MYADVERSRQQQRDVEGELRAERDTALARVKHTEDALNNALEQLASLGAELAALKAQIDDDALQAKADASEQEYYDER